jgi:ribosomal protein S18 acetylase RimI-like enzyme
LEVRAGNNGAICLYQGFDFKIIGRRIKYYPDGEDALVMEREISGD